MPTSALRATGGQSRPPLQVRRGSMWASTPTSLLISETPRISYVKYSTGTNRKTPKNQNTNQRSVCVLERTSSEMDELCRLRHSEGYGACEDAARRAFLDRQCNDNTQNVTTCFSARKRYFASPGTLFSTIFSLAREKMVPPGATFSYEKESGVENSAPAARLCAPPGAIIRSRLPGSTSCSS